MTGDIGHVLANWPYEPEKNVRVIRGVDGKEKIQVRLPAGIEQYEADGRPDGKRPNGCESLLDDYYARMRAWCEKRGSDEGFKLNSSDCARLGDEGILYYYRYVQLFQLGDYDRTVRDVERNRRMFDFVKKYAADPVDLTALEQYRPYLIRMSRVSSALKWVGEGDFDRALGFADMGLREIGALKNVDTDVFRFETKRSLDHLREVRESIIKRRPLSPVEELRKEINQAVAEENYERAAELRDRLHELQRQEELDAP